MHRVDSVMSLMTMEEKIGQMVLLTSHWDVTGPVMHENGEDEIRSGKCGNIFNAHSAAFTRSLQKIAVEESRLGIPLLFGYDVIHGFKTIYPIPLGLAASWDTDLVERCAAMAADEATAAGVTWTYAPMCDIALDPRWGRSMEGAGEDPCLGAAVAAAQVRGFQGKDNELSEINTLAACVKHFAAYGAAQAGRDYHTVDMSERVLREVYLPAYHAAVKQGARSVMASFNELDGVPATASKFLMKKILRDEWGFGGFVVTDYTGIDELVPHGVAATREDAACLAIKAGIDMDMESRAYYDFLYGLYRDGKVTEDEIDTAVRSILKVKFELGLFDDPYKYCNMERESAVILCPEYIELAREAAASSIVLLKNANSVLPLGKQERLALIGESIDSRSELLGSWRAAGDASRAATIREAFISACPGITAVSDLSKAVSAAAGADKIIFVAGERADMSGEAASRTSIRIPERQTEVLRQLKKTGKPVILVLMNGRAMDISEEDGLSDAVLDLWFPGTSGACALTDVVFGDVNPSAKLPVTFPRNLGQVPIYHYMKNTGRPFDESIPGDKYKSRYIDCSNTPLYPFGHGLSYTTFVYSPVELSSDTMSPDGTVEAKVTVTNTGNREGAEVVQLYVRDLVGSVTRPVKQLKGFEKISLAPGESREVRFVIDRELLSFYDIDMNYGAEPGEFRVMIGGSSDISEGKNFTLIK